MGCKSIAEQVAAALGKSDVNTSDQLPVIDNDTLYRVTVGDLALSLGLTGSLTSVGGSGVDVLTGTAPDYEIRKIRGGNGITAQQNIQGGITINANLANAGGASAGERLIPNTDTDPIRFKRIKAGTGIELSADSQSITINNTQATGDVASQVVVVSTIDDFPSAVLGVITLADNTVYRLINTVSTSNRFVMGSDTIITSDDPYASTLAYTGTGTMLTTSNGNQSISEITLDCPNGTLIDTTGNTSGNLLMRWVRVLELKDFGAIEKPVSGLYDILIVLLTGAGGINYGTQTTARANLTELTVLSATNAALNLVDLGTATFDAFVLTGVQILSTVAGQNFLSGAAASGNMTSGNIGLVRGVTIEGDMTALDTISTDDAGWDFSDNNTIADTDPHAVIYLNAEADTTIAAAGTPVQVNGTFTATDTQVYTAVASGTVTYNGRRPSFARVDTTISFEPVSGSNKDLFVQLAKNGTPVTGTKISRTASAGSAAVVSLDWGLELQESDEIALLVGNDSDTTNVTVFQALLRVS